MKNYDVAVIGAGITGAMIARSLAKYDLKTVILEKEHDVAMGSTKANSAIVHAGFDAENGTLKAKYNVEGSNMFESICRELGVKYQNIGALVLAYNDDDIKTLENLLQRGINNNVQGLEIVKDRAKLESLEPNIGKEVVAALYAPTSAITCPYELCIAAVGNAMDNGVDLLLDYEVNSIIKGESSYVINDDIQAKVVINAAGLYADKIAKLVNPDIDIAIIPRRGEYILLDKTEGSVARTTIFRCPSPMGKGILVSPTADGNIIVGPNAENIEDKEDKTTTPEAQELIKSAAQKLIENLNFRKGITYFAGLRSVGNTGDFIIGEDKDNPGFINVAGIESPGLSSAPAIGEDIAKLVSEKLDAKPNTTFDGKRTSDNFFKEMSLEEKNEYIKAHPEFGHTICRCEGVTEGEILRALRENPKARDLDGVKHRTRAQMGRCQGGFCSPYIVEIIAKELGISPLEVTKFGGKSNILVSKTK